MAGWLKARAGRVKAGARQFVCGGEFAFNHAVVTSGRAAVEVRTCHRIGDMIIEALRFFFEWWATEKKISCLN